MLTNVRLPNDISNSKSKNKKESYIYLVNIIDMQAHGTNLGINSKKDRKGKGAN
jgi:hypothetical protein